MMELVDTGYLKIFLGNLLTQAIERFLGNLLTQAIERYFFEFVDLGY